ncbi:hypothetical protein NM688_g6738 [Phlebia brevispora]|uniref:Uncharacterized protein n=1 Tax=Phlebia brevispora TaxID=194682 RepID=A0ACC1SD30_9APHY|nr:hypothetical protein NM688_g6738 [Phlebia brevispora]
MNLYRLASVQNASDQASSAEQDPSYPYTFRVYDIFTLDVEKTVMRPASSTQPLPDMAAAGHLGKTPVNPTVGISFKMLELVVICDYYSISYRHYLRTVLADSFEIYLRILRSLENEPELKFSRLYAFDGNNSLKRMLTLGNRETADLRLWDGNYFLPRPYVDQFANEVRSRPKGPYVPEEDLLSEDGDAAPSGGEPGEGEEREGESGCSSTSLANLTRGARYSVLLLGVACGIEAGAQFSGENRNWESHLKHSPTRMDVEGQQDTEEISEGDHGWRGRATENLGGETEDEDGPGVARGVLTLSCQADHSCCYDHREKAKPGSSSRILTETLPSWQTSFTAPTVHDPDGPGQLPSSHARAADTKVARLPVLGYNTWNFYQCNIDEDLIMSTAKLMQSLGLQDAGYNQMNLDDCWAEKNRTAEGLLVPDKVRFKSGFNYLTSQLHSMGFEAGIYSDSGWFTCAGYPGSFEHEESDAKTFQDWGFNYLKYDNCAIPYDDIIRQGTFGKYQRMANAIADLAKSSGNPPIIFSLCEWGWSQVWIWGKTVGQSWRTTGDISAQWESLTDIINFNSFITTATDFYGRNDMDMVSPLLVPLWIEVTFVMSGQLQLGNVGLSYDEAKSHFTAWALMKSPLLIGTNLSAITPDILDILTNKEILAINQDPVVGTSVSPFRWGINPDWTSNSTHPAQYWSGDSQNGTVFMLVRLLQSRSGGSDTMRSAAEHPGRTI